MIHEWVIIHRVNVKGCRELSVTMAAKQLTVYESANIGINCYNIILATKWAHAYLLLIFEYYASYYFKVIRQGKGNQ